MMKTQEIMFAVKINSGCVSAGKSIMCHQKPKGCGGGIKWYQDRLKKGKDENE